MNRLGIFLVAALVMGAATAFGADNMVGTAELEMVKSIFSGKIGLALGLAIATIGIFRIGSNDAGGGIFLVVVGVLVTLVPYIYSGFNAIVCPIAGQLTADATNKVNC